MGKLKTCFWFRAKLEAVAGELDLFLPQKKKRTFPTRAIRQESSDICGYLSYSYTPDSSVVVILVIFVKTKTAFVIFRHIRHIRQ